MHNPRPNDIPPIVVRLCRQLRDHGFRSWVVGGCIRDVLLGRPVSDWDLATDARPREVMRVFPRTVPTGIAHGTVTVLMQDEAFEVTTLRGEGDYHDGRRPASVQFLDDIEADLARRDFTVNAMAYDPIDDAFCDPFDGLADLRRKLIRAVGTPAERFAEDGLRVLRAARFCATLEFEVESHTHHAASQSLQTYRQVSRERIRDEWQKALAAATPSRAFEAMRTMGLLTVTMPALMDQVGCTQNHHHAYDVWTHTMQCVDRSENTPRLRLAALLHDIGKPATRAISEVTAEPTFYHHESLGAEMAAEWLRAYRFSNQEIDWVTRLVRHHLICYQPEWTDAAVRRFIQRVGADLLPDVFSLARADVLAKGKQGSSLDMELAAIDELRQRVHAQLESSAALTVKALAIHGGDLIQELGLAPGPVIGATLSHLLERVTDEPHMNERHALLELARQFQESVSR